MGRRGPAPKLNATQIVKGDPGKRARRAAAVEPVVPVADYDAPKWLDGEARAEWDRIVALFTEMERSGQRLMTALDVAALAVYCDAFSDYELARKQVAIEGKVLTTEKGYAYTNPWVAIQKTAAEQIKKFAAEFGFTPSARSRMQILPAKAPDKKKDRAAKIIGF